MKAIEREKALALSRCRMVRGSWDQRFVKGIAWTARFEPTKVLAWRQKYHLDELLYRYRVQLASQDLTFEVPTKAPVESDYEPVKRPPKQQRLEL